MSFKQPSTNMKGYISLLDQNTDNLLKIIDGLTMDTLSVKKANTWSIEEILGHIYLTDQAIYRLVSKKSSEIAGSKEIIGQQKLQEMLIGQRHRKVNAPEMLQPTGQFTTISDFRHAFNHVWVVNQQYYPPEKFNSASIFFQKV